MARKRLSDLLREEVKRSPDSDAQASNASAKANTNPKNSTKRTNKSSQPKQTVEAEVADTAPEQVNHADDREAKAKTAAAKALSTQAKALATKTSISSSAPLPEPETAQLTATVAELQQTIAALQADLQASQSNAGTLKDQITDLENTLQTQKEQIEHLQAKLEQARQDQSQLEEARQLILTLSENNLRVNQELEALKKEPAQPTSPSPSEFSRSPNSELRRILQHPVDIKLPSTTFSDSDLGWVD